jgi:hypothetical protein
MEMESNARPTPSHFTVALEQIGKLYHTLHTVHDTMEKDYFNILLEVVAKHVHWAALDPKDRPIRCNCQPYEVLDSNDWHAPRCAENCPLCRFTLEEISFEEYHQLTQHNID